MIEYKEISKSYGENVGVEDISVKIEDGEFVFLVGPSGAGKSTFVKLLLKLIDADSGSIMFNGYDVTELSPRQVPGHRRSMGIVFQDFSLLPKKTVFENVAFAMEIIQKPRRTIQRQVPAILELVGIGAEADKYPTEISIGEQQRVAIARAIVNNPSVLIADEPTGNLDPDTGWEIMHLLEQINRRGTTVLMVTHSREIVNAMTKRVIAIRDGKLVRDEEGGNYRPEEDDDDIVPATTKSEGVLPL
ncbi:MAG: cell division ATP-binding protein FtsE [Clostridiales Family XIII bacterium]|jgi:cell division transport system ATP-binding protein|nr:cell division ATP-binding protein FtsE [Clostridiales Family XIII bacterium]